MRRIRSICPGILGEATSLSLTTCSGLPPWSFRAHGLRKKKKTPNHRGTKTKSGGCWAVGHNKRQARVRRDCRPSAFGLPGSDSEDLQGSAGRASSARPGVLGVQYMGVPWGWCAGCRWQFLQVCLPVLRRSKVMPVAAGRSGIAATRTRGLQIRVPGAEQEVNKRRERQPLPVSCHLLSCSCPMGT